MIKIFKIAVVSIFILLLYFSNHIESEDNKKSELILSAVESKVMLGNTIYLSLIISGSDIDSIFKNDKFLTESMLKNDDPDFFWKNTEKNTSVKGFKYTFNIKPKKSGKFTIGPYSVDFQKKKLVSNTLTIEVINPPKSKKILVLSADNNTPKKHMDFKLEISGENEAIKDIEFINNDYLLQTSVSSGSTMTISFGAMTSNHSKSFTLKTLQKGKIIIDKNYFKNIPQGYKIIDLEIEIK